MGGPPGGRGAGHAAGCCHPRSLPGLRVLLLLLLGLLQAGQVRVHAKTTEQEREQQVLQAMWSYTPELPRNILSQAVGMQGDRSRLERFIAKLIEGVPVKVVLLGGSLSLRGWNHPDESYIRQLHKWMELTFVEGCREEAATRAAAEAAAPSPPQWKGKRKDAHLPQAQPQAPGAAKNKTKSKPSSQHRQMRHALYRSGRPGEAVQRGRQLLGSSPPGRQLLGSSALGQVDLSAAGPSEDEWIPERGPAPPSELHSVPSAGYRSLGHMCGGSRVELVNLAVSASGPGYAERCVLQRLPPDADLVLLDFGINDFQKADALQHPERQAFERIMRRALSLDTFPAVLMFEAYSPYQAKSSFVGVGLYKKENLSQDKHVLIAEYYGEVQVLSVRAALWQLISVAEEGGDPNLIIYLGRHFLKDLIHVTPFGHRWYADLLISYLRDVTSELLTRRIMARTLGKKLPEAARRAWAWPLSPPAPAAQQKLGGRCWAGLSPSPGACNVSGNLGRSYPVRVTPSGLKPPLFQDNEYQEAGVCAVGQEFFALVTERAGWEWQDDGKPGRPKWGFVSSGVGQRLVVSVDVSGHAAPPKSVNSDAALQVDAPRERTLHAFLIYLSSWQDMGSARVGCSGACACEPTTVDAMSKEQRFRASVPQVHEFRMLPLTEPTADPDPAFCRVSVEILEASSSQGHKFKVMGLTTSAHKLFKMEYIVREGEDRTASTATSP